MMKLLMCIPSLSSAWQSNYVGAYYYKYCTLYSQTSAKSYTKTR